MEIKTLLWNIEGLRNAINMIPEDIFDEYDIVTLTETFLTTQWSTENFYAAHSYASQGDRGRPKGGITMLIKPRLAPFEILQNTKNILLVKTNACTVLNAYFNPEYKAEEIEEEINQALRKTNTTDNVIIMGDLNCRIDVPTQKTKTVINYIEEEGFTLVNKRENHTYLGPNGASTIDLVFTNSDKTHQEIRRDIPVRKHIPICTVIYVKASQQRNTSRKQINKPSREIDKDRLNTEAVKNASKEIQEGKINEALGTIEGLIKQAIVRKESKQRKAKPWFKQECYTARRTAITALHKARQTKMREDLKEYNNARKSYKQTLKIHKERYTAEEEKKLIEQAEEKWYKVASPKQPYLPRDIAINTWEEHFKEVLQAKETRPEIPSAEEEVEESRPFSREEVRRQIANSKNNKACGPDGIVFEHLKETAGTLTDTWTELFNECLKQGNIPNKWRIATLKVLYKGKGDTRDPNSYRGIALECTALKILTSLLTERLRLMTEHTIPEQQFGFVKGRSTTQAVKCIQDDIESALGHPRGKLHAIFIDYTKAFDFLNRQLTIRRIEEITGRNQETRLIQSLLSRNLIEIDDRVSRSEMIEQTNGVLQGDPLSPLLFIIATAAIPAEIATENVKIYTYADDMVIVSQEIQQAQEAFNKLVAWAEKNDLNINERKTVKMTFRRGGRLAANDYILYKGKPMQNVTHFKYLGITLQSRGDTYDLHIKERALAARMAANSITNLSKLSLKTAMTIFRLKIIPIMTYGLEVIWEKLKKKNLEDIEKVKAHFLKRVLSLSKYTPSRLTYVLTKEQFFIEELRLDLLLPATEAYKDLLRELTTKKQEIWPEFFATDAMIYRDWTDARYDLRHIMTRVAVHGFHHQICTTEKYHNPEDKCKCKFCGSKCDRYHVMWCKNRGTSLTDFCKT